VRALVLHQVIARPNDDAAFSRRRQQRQVTLGEPSTGPRSERGDISERRKRHRMCPGLASRPIARSTGWRRLAASRSPQAAAPPLDRPARPGVGAAVLRLWCDANPTHRSPAALRAGSTSLATLNPRAPSPTALFRSEARRHSLLMAGSPLSVGTAGTGQSELWHHRGLQEEVKPVARIEPTNPFRPQARGAIFSRKQQQEAIQDLPRLLSTCSPSQGGSGAPQNCPADVKPFIRQHQEDIRRCACLLSWVGGCSRPLHPLAPTRDSRCLAPCTAKTKARQPASPQLLFFLSRPARLRYHFSCDASIVVHCVSRFCDISEAMSRVSHFKG